MTSINDDNIIISAIYWFIRNSNNDWKMSQNEIKIKLVFSFENYLAVKGAIKIAFEENQIFIFIIANLL